MDSEIPHPYDMVNDITASLQEEDDFHPTKWNCSKCHFLNNDDESSCQKKIVGGNRCLTPRYTVIIPWGSAFRGKAQTAANNEPRVSGHLTWQSVRAQQRPGKEEEEEEDSPKQDVEGAGVDPRRQLLDGQWQPRI
jgi:hypothetical protein